MLNGRLPENNVVMRFAIVFVLSFAVISLVTRAIGDPGPHPFLVTAIASGFIAGIELRRFRKGSRNALRRS